MIFHRAIRISYSYSVIAILALTTTAVAANHHHPTHSPTSWQTDFPTATDHHPNLRTYQNTTSSLHDKGSSDEYCEDQKVQCGHVIKAGETLTLKEDLVCTEAAGGRGNTAVAITVEEGATLKCDGNSIVQLNNEVGKAVECRYSYWPVTNPNGQPQTCGLAWGRYGVELKSGAKVEGCKVSGWYEGLVIKPPSGGYAKEIEIDNCEATLNRIGLYVDDGDVADFSVKSRYVYFLLYERLLSLCVFLILTLTRCA
jgi:hypothetical protein